MARAPAHGIANARMGMAYSDHAGNSKTYLWKNPFGQTVKTGKEAG